MAKKATKKKKAAPKARRAVKDLTPKAGVRGGTRGVGGGGGAGKVFFQDFSVY